MRTYMLLRVPKPKQATFLLYCLSTTTKCIMCQKLLAFILFSSIIFVSCKKSENEITECNTITNTYRTVLNAEAAIWQSTSNEFFIIEKSTIDTKLRPCNLPINFQVNGLAVTISGNVKSTFQYGPGSCCIDDFSITEITKR
jgi:hypothetical protein